MGFGFGRVVTINLFLALLLASRDLIDMVTCAFCPKLSERRGDERHIPEFLHRCMGYSIVVSTFLHCICVYFTYEDSLATHTFMDTYGWETFGTGWFVLFLLASVVASSNDTLSKTNTRLFHQTHWQSILLILVLIFHGGGFISTYYWQLIIVPIVFYFCDIFTRYLKGH